MNKLHSYLFNLRDTDNERYEYLKDFVDFIQLGYEIATEEIEDLKDENQKLHSAIERWMIIASKENGIYHDL